MDAQQGNQRIADQDFLRSKPWFVVNFCILAQILAKNSFWLDVIFKLHLGLKINTPTHKTTEFLGDFYE